MGEAFITRKGGKVPKGNAVANDVRAGKTFSNENDIGLTGTAIIANGNATVGDVLGGKTFSNSDAAGLTGTMTNRGIHVITPSASNITIPQGYHNGNGFVWGSPNLIASNIKSGMDIFGVMGNLIPYKIIYGQASWASDVSYVYRINKPVDITSIKFISGCVWTLSYKSFAFNLDYVNGVCNGGWCKSANGGYCGIVNFSTIASINIDSNYITITFTAGTGYYLSETGANIHTVLIYTQEVNI